MKFTCISLYLCMVYQNKPCAHYMHVCISGVPYRFAGSSAHATAKCKVRFHAEF